MTGRRRTLIALEVIAAGFLIWIGWSGIVAPATELPNSLFKIPLFLFGLAWAGLIVFRLVRGLRGGQGE